MTDFQVQTCNAPLQPKTYRLLPDPSPNRESRVSFSGPFHSPIDCRLKPNQQPHFACQRAGYLRRESVEKAEIRGEILDILSEIAPDEDLSNLKDDVSFREQMELDSMDFLDIVMELRKRHRVQIPEDEYGNLASMDSTVNYLEPKMRDL